MGAYVDTGLVLKPFVGSVEVKETVTIVIRIYVLILKKHVYANFSLLRAAC